ncbi:hypothetical protein ACFOWM_01445 [Ferruginibacter yonginensis]|uniref:Bacterial transcription activator effector binding domain-containing protein n=1 Tax=Ferruginibacter yonginensis TaxID=1310416 RepID=A0ABV8QR68_9BACT
MIRFVTTTLLFTVTLFSISCKSKQPANVPPPLVKKEKPSQPTDKLQKGPIINVIDTITPKQVYIIIKDSAATSAGLSVKLNNIYNKKLVDFIKTNKLKVTGAPTAWYKTQKAPFFFEAGLPIEKAPNKLAKGIMVKRTGGDSALLAHFFGPYDLTNVGYESLAEILKDRKKRKSAPAFEIYVQNPFEPSKVKIDPYKMQTDIVMPYKN